MKKRDDIFYQAMLTRDPRFDGKFFIGVKTTGIYCRPICPAKPKRQNVEFFTHYIAAEKAGYRPCLRCRPESAPYSPAWIGTSAVVQRAIKVLHSRDAITLNEDSFAAQFGVTARHLRRLFVAEIGKTPKQLSFECRLNLSRKLITETSLTITAVAFASGFSSIRRFNDAFKERFKKTPSDIRRNKIKTGEPLGISLSYRPPFDFEGLLASYEKHRIGDLEWFENQKMFRVIAIDDTVGVIAISNQPEKMQVHIEIDFSDSSKIQTIIAKVRSLLDLDSDPLVIANALEVDPKMASIVRKFPGIRLPSGWDGFEIAISTILGQLVSVEQARLLVGQLIALTGKDSGLFTPAGKAIKLFPTPRAIATADLTNLRTTKIRKQTLADFSRLVDEKKISLEPTQDVEEFSKKLLAVKGIGPWTANYMALKILRHTDAFPATDLIIARALKLHPKKTIESMRPWRGYATMLLWREYAGSLKATTATSNK